MLNDLVLFLVFWVVLILCAIPLGKYMTKVFNGEKTLFDKVFGPIERTIYRVTGVDSKEEMDWKKYALNLVVFNVIGLVALFIILMIQQMMPLNPQKMGAQISWHLAFNTAASFMTNTNWQSYAGESTLTYFSQMMGLTVQNFLSAATGMTVIIALIRGITRKSSTGLGNFWSDMVKGTIYVLLPISMLIAVVFVQQGVIQNFSPYEVVKTLEGGSQTIAMGPVASQEAIKLLGTNGGGFFNANSSHPFENPTSFTDFLQMFAIFIIPVSLTFVFGHMVKDRRQGLAILAAMMILFAVMLGIVYSSELAGNPIMEKMGVLAPTAMEGKEMRFGIGESSLFATVTTAASCGAVSAMLDSFTPLGGLAPMLQLMLGEVVIGGVGAGMYGMMMYVIFTVFIVGLMVGRTPEYLGKKIEAREMKLAILAVLIPSVTLLIFSAVASTTQVGLSSLNNAGPHGLSEMLYAFASGVGNNGSAFAGLNANTPFYNVMLGLAMLIGRFAVILPVLGIAGSLVQKKTSPMGPGTFSTNKPLFVLLLAGIVFLVGALTFMPALALGPIVEHMLMGIGAGF